MTDLNQLKSDLFLVIETQKGILIRLDILEEEKDKLERQWKEAHEKEWELKRKIQEMGND
jgi:hypothetical protein